MDKHHHHHSKRLSAPMDYTSRKHIEDLHLLTDEILHRQQHVHYEYDYKLYRKYKKLKEINRQLQEKIINQHCSGCQCHSQTDEDLTDSILCISPKVSIKTENKENDSPDNSPSIIESSLNDNEGQMDANVNVTKTTDNDNIIEQEEEDEEEEVGIFTNLPSALKDIILDKVAHANKYKVYLLKLGLYPEICAYLSDLKSEFGNKPTQSCMDSFIVEQLKPKANFYTKRSLLFANELCSIRKSYLLKCKIKPPNSRTSKRTQESTNSELNDK